MTRKRILGYIPVILLLISRLSIMASTRQDTIYLSDFGLKPDTRENAVPYLQKALESVGDKKGKVLCFSKGRYDFWPQHCIERVYFESNTTNNGVKRLAILIEGKKDLTIEGAGSDFVYHDRMQPFTVDSSENILIKNLSIDWEIPLTAQAEISAVEETYIDLKINHCESPYIIENGKLVFVGEGWKSEWSGAMEFDRKTLQVAPQTGDAQCLGRDWRKYRAEELSPGVVRLYYSFQRKPAVGNWLVLRHSERDHAGIFITNSKQVRIEDLNMYHNAGLGILSQYSEALSFTNVNCIPNRAKGRILAGHDDGFHYSNCRGDLLVDHCTFHALMDDPINVHGTAVRIIEKLNDFTLRCKFMHEQSKGLNWARPGEKIGFIENTSMNTFATGLVKSFSPIDAESFDIEFQEVIPGQAIKGNALENLSWTSNVQIKNSSFMSCRARGILVSTPGKVIIENNSFESSGSAILIAGDANYWYETGAVKDVLIRNNLFKSPCLTSIYQFCEGVISIYPEIPVLSKKNKPFHRNIQIVQNEFHLFDYPVLFAKSVENITFMQNKLIRSYDFKLFHPRKDGLTFEACRNISIKNNKVDDNILGKTIRLVETPRKELHIDDVSSWKLIK